MGVNEIFVGGFAAVNGEHQFWVSGHCGALSRRFSDGDASVLSFSASFRNMDLVYVAVRVQRPGFPGVVSQQWQPVATGVARMGGAKALLSSARGDGV